MANNELHSELVEAFKQKDHRKIYSILKELKKIDKEAAKKIINTPFSADVEFEGNEKYVSSINFLHLALSISSDPYSYKEILDLGADINARDSEHRTPLDYALSKQSILIDTINDLIEKDAYSTQGNDYVICELIKRAQKFNYEERPIFRIVKKIIENSKDSWLYERPILSLFSSFNDPFLYSLSTNYYNAVELLLVNKYHNTYITLTKFDDLYKEYYDHDISYKDFLTDEYFDKYQIAESDRSRYKNLKISADKAYNIYMLEKNSDEITNYLKENNDEIAKYLKENEQDLITLEILKNKLRSRVISLEENYKKDKNEKTELYNLNQSQDNIDTEPYDDGFGEIDFSEFENVDWEQMRKDSLKEKKNQILETRQLLRNTELSISTDKADNIFSLENNDEIIKHLKENQEDIITLEILKNKLESRITYLQENHKKDKEEKLKSDNQSGQKQVKQDSLEIQKNEIANAKQLIEYINLLLEPSRQEKDLIEIIEMNLGSISNKLYPKDFLLSTPYSSLKSFSKDPSLNKMDKDETKKAEYENNLNKTLASYNNKPHFKAENLINFILFELGRSNYLDELKYIKIFSDLTIQAEKENIFEILDSIMNMENFNGSKIQTSKEKYENFKFEILTSTTIKRAENLKLAEDYDVKEEDIKKEKESICNDLQTIKNSEKFSNKFPLRKEVETWEEYIKSSNSSIESRQKS